MITAFAIEFPSTLGTDRVVLVKEFSGEVGSGEVRRTMRHLAARMGSLEPEIVVVQNGSQTYFDLLEEADDQVDRAAYYGFGQGCI